MGKNMDRIIFFIRAQGSKFWGKWGSGRDQNNGKKIGINGSRIYHVTTLSILLAELNMSSQYTVYPQTLAYPAEYTKQSKAKILKKFVAKP